jgi:hypothetical protein
MNKMIIIIAVAISIFLFTCGIACRSQAHVINEQENRLFHTNDDMDQELRQKEGFEKKQPVEMSTAFGFLVNLLRMFENYGDAKMELLLITKKDKENLEDHFSGSIFRNVKSLPIDLKITNFTGEADLSFVLNEIYLLEKLTDLKVFEISEEHDVIEVKGVLYGI